VAAVGPTVGSTTGLAIGVTIGLTIGLTPPAAARDATLLPFSADERTAIATHGPWPPPLRRDPGNRLSGRPAAVAFGERLFQDPRLSASGAIACSHCHIPARDFVDGRTLAAGQQIGQRHTPSVVNARFARWQGWAGDTDSLWAASIRPLLDAAEMGPAERVVAERVRSEPDLACGYRAATGRAPGPDDEVVIADLGKSLAAFQETLVSAPSPFDHFRDALRRGARRAAARYPPAAQRGLKLFIGDAGCALCHRGPLFTHGEFDHAGIPVRGADGRIDWGRYSGVKALRASRYNLLTRHNDDATRANAPGTRHVAPEVETYGAFRVPGLRNVADTPPYMHDGSLPTLEAVVRHYSTIDEVKLHVAAAHPHAEPGEPMPPRPTASALRALNLSDGQVADLVAFLQTLSAPLRPAPPALRGVGTPCP
jgi:cytochrome c peroxidase